MKKKIFFIVISLLAVCLAEMCRAQESQIPIDAEGKLEFIDSELEQELRLFTEYSNFREARLFQISETSFMLEISYKPEDKILRTRLSLSAEEAKEFQRKVTERIKQTKPGALLDQEGRTKLIFGITSISLGYYGWAVPEILKVEESKTAAALYMLISGAGFFVPFSLTKNINVTDAAATLSVYGGTRGIVHGIAFANLIGTDPSGESVIAAGMAASIAEMIGLFQVANKSKMSAGRAATIGIGGDFGIGYGLGAAHLADLDEHAAWGSLLVGSGIGFVAGNLLTKNQPYTQGDASVLEGVGILGAFIPLAIVDIAEGKDKAYIAAAMIGATIGLGAGHKLVRGKDFTTGQGRLIELGEFAGGLVGLGVAYLLSSNGDDSELFLTASAIGATAGFSIMYGSFASKVQTSEKGFSWNINLRPEGLLSLAMGDRFKPVLRPSPPLFNFDFKF